MEPRYFVTGNNAGPSDNFPVVKFTKIVKVQNKAHLHLS